MSLRLKALIRNPISFAIRLAAHVNPKWLFGLNSRRLLRQGVTQSRFVLSFDCDTDHDIGVAENVHARLREMGIVAVCAVPGQLLEQGAQVYRRIAGAGTEFINHGYASHSAYHAETKTYKSTLSYETLSHNQILQDIRRGHEAVAGILGTPPLGFRTPHFGNFQGPDQLRFIHASLKSMGYRYSTSTVPLYGFRYGPWREVLDGFLEIPVSGCFDHPFVIPDSWNFRVAPDRPFKGGDFLQQIERLVAYFREPGHVGVLNLYADPSQVFDWPEFFEAMKLLAPWSVGSYCALLKN